MKYIIKCIIYFIISLLQLRLEFGNLNNLLGNWDDELEEEEEDVPVVNKVKTILGNWDELEEEEVDEELPMVGINRALFEFE